MKTKDKVQSAVVSIGLLVLLVAPITSAQPIEAGLSVQGIAVEGPAQTQGKVVGLFMDPQFSENNPRIEFTLEAQDIRAEIDYADPVLRVGGLYSYAHDPKVEVTEYASARVVNADQQYDNRLHVLPVNSNEPVTFQARSDCGKLQFNPPNSEEVRRIPLVRPGVREDAVASTSDATAMDGCTGSTVELDLEGDLVLALWGITVEVASKEGTKLIRSGTMDSESNAMANPAVERIQQAFLYASDARLTMSLPADEFGLFVRNVQTSMQGATVTVEGASGELLTAPDQVFHVDDDRVSMVGDLEMDIHDAVVNHSLAVEIKGDATTAYKDGEPIPLTTAAAPSSSSWSWLWVGAPAVLGIIIAAIGVYVWQRPMRYYRANAGLDGKRPSLEPRTRRHRRAIGHWLLSYRASKRKKYHRSHWHADRAVKDFPELPEGRAMRAFAAAHINQIQEALHDFEDAYNGLDRSHNRADVCVAAALACIHASDHKDAVAWLKRGFHDDPLFVMEQARRPAFESLQDHSWMQMIHTGRKMMGPTGTTSSSYS